MFTLDEMVCTTCAEVIAALRDDGVIGIECLVANGAVVDPSDPSEILTSGVVMIVQEQLPSDAVLLEPTHTPPPPIEPEQHAPLITRDVADRLSYFTRWFLNLGDAQHMTEAFNQIIDDHERLNAEGTPMERPYEELLDTHYPVPDAKLVQLTDMGFPQSLSKRALWLHEFDVARALSVLLEGSSMRPITKDQFVRIKQHYANDVDSVGGLVAEEALGGGLQGRAMVCVVSVGEKWQYPWVCNCFYQKHQHTVASVRPELPPWTGKRAKSSVHLF